MWWSLGLFHTTNVRLTESVNWFNIHLYMIYTFPGKNTLAWVSALYFFSSFVCLAKSVNLTFNEQVAFFCRDIRLTTGYKTHENDHRILPLQRYSGLLLHLLLRWNENKVTAVRNVSTVFWKFVLLVIIRSREKAEIRLFVERWELTPEISSTKGEKVAEQPTLHEQNWSIHQPGDNSSCVITDRSGV